MSFSQGEILLVPVAFTDGSGVKRRPVVVVHDSGDADLLVAPVTSQAVRSARDVPINDWRQAGLRLPSLARMDKLATVEKSTVVKSLGKLTPGDRKKVKDVLNKFFAEIIAD